MLPETQGVLRQLKNTYGGGSGGGVCRLRPHSRARSGRPCSNTPFLELVGLVVSHLVCTTQAYSKFSFNDVVDASLLSAMSGFRMKLYLVENQAFLTSPEGIFSLCANSPFMQREFCGFLADTCGKHLSEHHSLPAKFRAMCHMSAQPALGYRWLLCKLCWDPLLG